MNICRTRFDPNKFIFKGNVCLIKLYDKHGNEKDEAIIDAEDYEKVKDHKWCSVKRGYVKSTMLGKYLHHVILNFKFKNFNKQVDHINENRRDNRKINLRICNHSQNLCNTGRPVNNTSTVKGVHWCKNANKWRAVIRKNRKKYHLGYYKSKKDAGLAYRHACLSLHGEHANCG